jgi:murein peptide amidase A
VSRRLAGGVALAGIAALLAAPAAGAETRVIGHSVEGREIVAERIGDPAASRVALAVGVIHGDETAGLKVTAALRRAAPFDGVQLWVIDRLNPDGALAGTRKNAHGVDLNRNFPHRWRGGVPRGSGYYPGPSPASEPETRAAIDFISEIKPDVSLWYHQPWGAVLACKGKPKLAARYAKLVKMRGSCRGKRLRGTAIGWQNATQPGLAFVVEFGAGSISQRTARRHARAVGMIASDD